MTPAPARPPATGPPPRGPASSDVVEIDWTRFFGRYRSLAVRVGRGLVGREDLAEELVHEAARALLERAEAGELAFESVAHARNYLLRAVRNLAVSSARRAGRNPTTSLEEASEAALPRAPEPEDDWDEELVGQVEGALAALGPNEHEALTLRYYHGLTYREIADRTGSSISTLQSRVEAALNKIRRRIGNELARA